MHAPNGETAHELTAPMLEALHTLIASHPAPHFVVPISVQSALRRRGFIVPVIPCDLVAARTLYNITTSGRTAYRITKRQMLGREDSNADHSL